MNLKEIKKCNQNCESEIKMKQNKIQFIEDKLNNLNSILEKIDKISKEDQEQEEENEVEN